MANDKIYLFVSNGKPMQFHIRGVEPPSERSKLKDLIEKFGGAVTNKQKDGVTKLATFVQGKEYPKNVYSVKYVYSCTDLGKLLPLDQFPVEEDNDDDEEEEEEEEEDESDGGLQKEPFTQSDDEQIVEFLNKNKLHKYLVVNETYELMSIIPKLNKFKPMSLKKRFFRDILPRIADFDVTDDDVKCFQNDGMSDDDELSVKAEPETPDLTATPVEDEAILPDTGTTETSTTNATKKQAAVNFIAGMRSSLYDKANPKYVTKSQITAVPILYDDCVEILNYISSNNCLQELKSDSVWKHMSQQPALKKFPYHMLREKFEREILPRILDYVTNVGPKKLKEFLIYAGKERVMMPDAVKYGLCQVLQECSDPKCKYTHNAGKVRDEFTKLEDLAILNFIVKKNCFTDIKKMEVWKEMSKQTELQFHTIRNLRKRFKALLSMLKIRNSTIRNLISEDKLKLFLDNYESITKDIKALEASETEREFTRAEDYAILGFIMEKHCIKDLEQNEVWREMQKHSDLKHHTPEALRKRFETYLLPNVESYNHCLPRKFLNCFMEYRFSKTNPKASKVRDSEMLVKLCLPDENQVSDDGQDYSSKRPRRVRLEKTNSSNRSEALKIFNLKKSLGNKLSSVPPKKATPKRVQASTSVRVESVEPQIPKKVVAVVPETKTTQDNKSTTKKTPEKEPEVEIPSRELRSKRKPNDNNTQEIVQTKVVRKNTDETTTTTSNQGLFNILKGKLDKSLAIKMEVDETEASTSLRPKPNNAKEKENLTEKPNKRVRGKLTETSAASTTQNTSGNSANSSTSTSINELLNVADQGVSDVDEKIKKWCQEATSNTVNLKIADLRSLRANLKSVQQNIYKANLAVRVEAILKTPQHTRTTDDEYELYKYLQVFKTT